MVIPMIRTCRLEGDVNSSQLEQSFEKTKDLLPTTTYQSKIKNRTTVATAMDASITKANPTHHKHPNRDIDQWKYLNVGRKPGACMKPRRKQLQLIPAYINK
jgi:hypothetical protein